MQEGRKSFAEGENATQAFEWSIPGRAASGCDSRGKSDPAVGDRGGMGVPKGQDHQPPQEVKN